jgi:hypothetical protein
MTEPGAAAMTVCAFPRIDVAALRDLRRLLDTTRSFSDARSTTDRTNDDEKMPTFQPNLFDMATEKDKMCLPQNIQTAPLKPLLRALLTDLIAARRFPVRKDEAKS